MGKMFELIQSYLELLILIYRLYYKNLIALMVLFNEYSLSEYSLSDGNAEFQ